MQFVASCNNGKKLTISFGLGNFPTELYIYIHEWTNMSFHKTRNCVKRASRALNVMKAQAVSSWGFLTETLGPHIRPSCVPSSTTPPPSGSPKYPNHTWKNLVIQSKALGIATGCHQKVVLSHLRAETGVLPLRTHLELCCQQFYASTL